MVKNFAEEKSKKRTKRLKDIDNKLHEIKEYIENLKNIRSTTKNEKSIFKQIIISKDEMDKFEKEERKKNCKRQLV